MFNHDRFFKKREPLTPTSFFNKLNRSYDHKEDSPGSEIECGKPESSADCNTSQVMDSLMSQNITTSSCQDSEAVTSQKERVSPYGSFRFSRMSRKPILGKFRSAYDKTSPSVNNDYKPVKPREGSLLSVSKSNLDNDIIRPEIVNGRDKEIDNLSDSQQSSSYHVDSQPSSSTHMDTQPSSSTHEDSQQSSSTHLDSEKSSSTRVDSQQSSSTRVDSQQSSSDFVDSSQIDLDDVDDCNDISRDLLPSGSSSVSESHCGLFMNSNTTKQTNIISSYSRSRLGIMTSVKDDAAASYRSVEDGINSLSQKSSHNSLIRTGNYNMV